MKKILISVLAVAALVAMPSCKSNEERLAELQQEVIEAYNKGDMKKVMKLEAEMAKLSEKNKSSGSSSNGEVASLRSQYIDACAEGNFEEARKYVQKIEALESGRRLDEHVKYVNDKEIYALLAHLDKDNANRILYLYNSHEPMQLPDMQDVLEVAISQSNEYLPTKLIQAGVKPSVKAARSAASFDMEDLFKMIVENNPMALTDLKVVEYYIGNLGAENYEDAVIKNMAKLDEVRLADIADSNNLAKLKSALANKDAEALKAQFNDVYSRKISKRPAIGTVKSDGYGEIPEEYISYRREVESYNSDCRELLSTAIEQKDWAMAQKVIGIMKPNLEWNNLGDWSKVVDHNNDVSSVYNAFKVIENSDDINSARQLLNQAKR